MYISEKETEYGVPYGSCAVVADIDYINSDSYARKCANITGNPAVNATLLECSRKAIIHRSGTLYEDMYLINGNTGAILGKQTESECTQGIIYNDEIINALYMSKANNIPVIALHTHPEGFPPSAEDFNKAFENQYMLGVASGHNGQIYTYKNSHIYIEDIDTLQMIIANAYNGGVDVDRAHREAYKFYGLDYTVVKE